MGSSPTNLSPDSRVAGHQNSFAHQVDPRSIRCQCESDGRCVENRASMRLCHSSFGSRQYGPQLVNREGTALENFAILGRPLPLFQRGLATGSRLGELSDDR